jgi:hypothetical protein
VFPDIKVPELLIIFDSFVFLCHLF